MDDAHARAISELRSVSVMTSYREVQRISIVAAATSGLLLTRPTTVAAAFGVGGSGYAARTGVHE